MINAIVCFVLGHRWDVRTASEKLDWRIRRALGAGSMTLAYILAGKPIKIRCARCGKETLR